MSTDISRNGILVDAKVSRGQNNCVIDIKIENSL
jgi:hypothetical protein